jgi:predicted nucleic acid-binding protein
VRERLVLDASAALAVLRAEPHGERIRSVLASPGAEGIHVPDHFWLEVINVLGRAVDRPGAEIAARVRELDELGLATVAIDRPLVLLALDLMARHALTAYDAAYLALAIAVDADIVTLDVPLAAAAGERDVLGTRRGAGVSEERAAYGPSDAIATWAGFGSYLAKLRAETLEAGR